MGDVGPGDEETAADIPPVGRSVPAGQGLAGQPGRPDDGPVQVAVAQDILHLGQVGVVRAQCPFDDGAGQVAGWYAFTTTTDGDGRNVTG